MPEAPADRARELREQHRRIPVARHRSLALHWMAGWLRPPRPARHEPLPRLEPHQLAITFGGHATALVRYAGLDIAFDPMLGRWLGGVRRAQEAGLAPGDFDRTGLVLISHRHRDHLHLATLARLPRSATIVVPPGGAAEVSPLGFARVVEIAAGGDLEMRGVQIHATPMAHGDDDRARGLSYVVRGDGPSVFLCGDGGYFSGFADVGARFAPDLALLPIAGFVPSSFRQRHMSPLDALYAFEDLRARLMIPIHHGAFALSYERLGEPARWLAQLVKERGLEAHVRVLQPGESEVFVPPRPARGPTAEPVPEAEAEAEAEAEIPEIEHEHEHAPAPQPPPRAPAETSEYVEPETAEHEAATTPRMPSALGALLREIATEPSDAIPITVSTETSGSNSGRVFPLPA